MPSRRRLLPVVLIAAALAPCAVARADDCGIEGTYFSGRAALTATGASAALGTFVAGSEASPAEVRVFTLGHGAPTSARLSAPGTRLSTPAFARRPDGALEAIVAVAQGQTPVGIQALAQDASGAIARQLLVPGVSYGDFGDDVLGAAIAPDGTLTIAYAVAGDVLSSPRAPTVRLARFDAGGRPTATLDLPAPSRTPVLATVASDGTTLIVAGGVATAYRWAPGASALQPIALPEAPGAPGDDDALQPDGQGGAWVRLGSRLLHVGTNAAAYVATMNNMTTVQVDGAGRALLGHGAKVATIDPAGHVVADAKVSGAVRGAGTVRVEAVAPSAGARPSVLISQTRRKRRTLTLIRPDRSRATVAAKARNFTTDAQLATLADGTSWAVWQDAHATFDQICNIESEDDVSVQAVRITPHARRAVAKALADAPATVETS